MKRPQHHGPALQSMGSGSTYSYDESRGFRKKQMRWEKIFEDYGVVIFAATVFTFCCIVVALRGHSEFWKKHAHATKEELGRIAAAKEALQGHVHSKDAHVARQEGTLSEMRVKYNTALQELSNEKHKVEQRNQELQHEKMAAASAQEEKEHLSSQLSQCNRQVAEMHTSLTADRAQQDEVQRRLKYLESRELELLTDKRKLEYQVSVLSNAAALQTAGAGGVPVAIQPTLNIQAPAANTEGNAVPANAPNLQGQGQQQQVPVPAPPVSPQPPGTQQQPQQNQGGVHL